jgi:Zn-dependent M28 family amino/carboxypeptidase
MLKFYLTFFLVIILNVLSAQNVSVSYSNRLSVDSIRENVLILASDSLEGRETGHVGQRKAAAFLASKYQSWDYLPAKHFFDTTAKKSIANDKSFLQNHPISIRNNKGRNLSVNGENFLFGKDFYYDSWLGDTTLFITQFNFIGVKNLESFRKSAVSINRNFKNVLFFNESSDTEEVNNSIFSYNDSSLVLVVVKQDVIKELFSEESPAKKIPSNQILISETIASKFFKKNGFEKIIRKIKRNGKTRDLSITCEFSLAVVKDIQQLTGHNVISFIPGSGKTNETIIISCHYDHLGKTDTSIYYGADDNASGTASVLEMARIFSIAKKEGHTLKRNIMFLNVSGEEKGLLGSSWFVNHPFVPVSDMVANLNIDMIGRTDAYYDSIGVREYVYIIGSDKLSTDLHNINESQNKSGPDLQLDYKYNNESDPNRYYRRSDHYNFAKKGVPVIFYFNGSHPDYHKPSDTSEKIQFDLIQKRAKLVFLTAWELANREKRIVVDKEFMPEKK